MYAHRFCSVVHDPKVAEAIGKSIPAAEKTKTDGPPKSLPFDPWSVLDFSRHVGATVRNVVRVHNYRCST